MWSGRSRRIIQGNHIHKSANENSQKHTAGAGQLHNQITAAVTVFLVWQETSTAPSATLPCNGKKMWKMRYHWPFRACLQGWNTTTSLTAAIQFCLWRHKWGSFRYGVWYNPGTVCKKYFANLHLIHGEKTKAVKGKINSASTYNTISSSLLRNSSG